MAPIEYEINEQEERFWEMCEEEHQDDPNYMRHEFEQAERAALESEWEQDTSNDD